MIRLYRLNKWCRPHIVLQLLSLRSYTHLHPKIFRYTSAVLIYYCANIVDGAGGDRFYNQHLNGTI